MCDDNGCCQECQDRANELGVHPGSAGPDKLGDTQPIVLSTGQPKFSAPQGLQEPRDVDMARMSPDQRKADYVQRQANAAQYFQFG